VAVTEEYFSENGTDEGYATDSAGNGTDGLWRLVDPLVLKSEQNRDGGSSRERILLPNQARAKIKKRLAALDQKVPLRPTPHDILLSISL
jgi:hypothetical protein